MLHVGSFIEYLGISLGSLVNDCQLIDIADIRLAFIML